MRLLAPVTNLALLLPNEVLISPPAGIIIWYYNFVTHNLDLRFADGITESM